MADAETSLRALLRRLATDHGYQDSNIDVKAITSGGANFTSALFLANITSPNRPELKLFAKVAAIGDKFRERMNGDVLFGAEQTFYNKLIKIWAAIDEKYQVPESDRIGFPKYYGGSPEKGSETIVLENLVAAGYTSYSRFKSVDWEHASKSVEALAKYHALSYIYAREDPEDYAAMVEELTFQMKEDEDPEMKGIWERMVGGSLAVLDDEQREKVKTFFESNDPRELFLKFNRPTHAPVFIHGDYRPSNMLFKKQEGELQVITLDFQTVRSGCPAADLVYFVTMGTDEEFRRDHYHQLVDHYYEQLVLALKRYRLEPDEVYSRELFDDDLKQMLPHAAVIGVIVLPVVTVEAESAPRIDGDADLDSFMVPPNQLYASRYRGIVADLIRWGAL